VSTVIAIITAGLLWTNVRAFGHITGPQPVGKSSITTWPLHFADLGLAFPGAFSSSNLVQTIQRSYPGAMLVLGLTLMSAACVLIAVSFLRPFSAYSRAMALVAGGYIVTIVTMRATTPFPELSYPRYLFPALFPLTFLLVSRPAVARSRLVMIGGALSVIASVALAARGIAADQQADIAAARAFLATALRPGDTVTVNLPSRGLAAYFNNRFAYVGDAEGNDGAWTVSRRNWHPARTTYTVVGARGTPAARVFDAGELDAVMAAVDAGQVEIVHRSESAIVLRAHAAGVSQ
jgi:hypothetical protein